MRRIIPNKLKSEILKAVIRLTLIYVLKIAAMKKPDETKLMLQ